MRIVIQPLAEEYESITLRSSMIDSFLTCPHKFKYSVNTEKDIERFSLGTKLHSYIQPLCFNKNNRQQLVNLCLQEEPEEESDYIVQCLNLAYEHCQPIFISEREYALEFEIGKYLVTFTGHLDGIGLDGTMIDYKSSKVEWKDEDIWEDPETKTKIKKFQALSYVALRNFAKSKETDPSLITGTQKFTFDIFTKHKTVRYQQVSLEIDIQEALESVKKVAINYALAHANNIRDPSANKYCRGCGLYSTTCPLYHFAVDKSKLR